MLAMTLQFTAVRRRLLCDCVQLDLGEEDVVGFIRGGDDSTELAVVEEMQGQVSDRNYNFYSEPKIQCGQLAD